MSSKKFLKIFFLSIFIIFFIIGGINYTIDPFNIFSHKNSLNKLQKGFNERLQKSVFLFYNTSLDYNAVLLGSSRSTYYNQNDYFKGKLYNFAFSGAQVQEYKKYLEFFNKINKKELDTIILGLDFYTYRMDKNIEAIKFPNETKLAFFINNYFLLSTLKYSLINIKRSYFNETGHRSYNRDNIVETTKVSYEDSKEQTIKRSKKYYENFIIDNTYKKNLLELKNTFNHSNFIIFIPPLSKPFLEEIYSDNKLFLIYMEWLKTLIDIFGEVYLFSNLDNKWSVNYEKYTMDGDHFYPEIGKEIFKQIITNKLDEGILLRKDNFKDFFSKYSIIER
ncbi:hypothetical protein [Aliarcobacter butzleri]|uniref:hypothetical protein n=1 Tax=Aliarcobacter butzleri TaxID=28197 RepID=UPI00126063B7|nr:hypothetical protein [Aliarcobacter butzleri]MDN5049856.1 hypothetical protein [Aliarcobacter butzleri]MDN5057093.1 hypothetical protein [Aliarcobacter butzleri]